MTSDGTLRVVAGALSLWLLVGCGGTSSRRDAQPASAGEPGDLPGAGGTPAASGGIVASGGGGGTGTSAGAGSVGGSLGDGGAAGEAAVPDLPLPSGCRARTPSETSQLCSLGVDCDTGSSVRTNCYRLDSGDWQCQCANVESMYRLKNVEGLGACALAAQICSGENWELGEESCEHTSERSDADSCGTEFACSKSIALDATTKAQAWVVRSGSARCKQWQPGSTFSCDCTNGTEKSTHALIAKSSELACGPMADFCLTGTSPVFDGAWVCLPGYSSFDGTTCGSAESCGGQHPLADGVSLVQLEERHALCTAGSGAGSECSCDNQESAFLFQLPAAVSDATCESALRSCDPNAITATGTAKCEPLTVETGGPDMCRTFLNCDQKAMVGEQSILGHGTLIVVCRRLEQGMPWVCSAASGPRTSHLELGAANANATQACSQASTAFLANPGLYLGMARDPMDPPDPLF